ncbi:bark storage protein A-like [Vitis riparia]|uniref:bark storage protein A-like n=1 Tax=Vitis riparia TaxID=96939 RepID=UPI00155B274A|nr:bark storage protein A-like [Vitis riparia]
MDNIKRYHVAHQIPHPTITALPTFSPAFTVYLFPGASTAVRSPSAAGSSMIGGRGGVVGGWRWGLWAVDLVGLLVVAVMVEETVELKLSHHLHGVVERVNERNGPFVGLLMTYPTEEIALQVSGFFVPSSDFPLVQLAGRRFNIGKIKGVDVIYVMSGEQTLNAGITVQLLIDTFDVVGIVHYGIAGSTNDSLLIGDVSVPKYVAQTSSWKWKKFKSKKGELPELKFGDYNLPIKGENLLAEIEFTQVQLYSTGRPMQELFWLETDPKWFNLATQLQEVNLQQCLNETYCLPEKPKVAYGLRGSSADIFVDNAAYNEFLFKTLNISTVDEESAAVVMASMSNGVPSVVFRGISDTAGDGGTLSSSIFSLAATNAVRVAVEFIGLLGREGKVHDQ